MGKVSFAVLMDQHVRTCERVNLSIKLDPVKLLRFDLFGFDSAWPTGFADHVAHCFDEKRPGPGASVEDAIILVYVE